MIGMIYKSSTNSLTGFYVYKTPLEEEMEYHRKINKSVDCKEYCNQELCDSFQTQQIYYDLCKECAKKGKCYDPYKEDCIYCKNRMSCEKMFGCDGEKPLNPAYNECKKCWPKII